MASPIATTAAGAIFGSALSAAGVASPSVILSQLRLENFHMFEVFLTATGCSALIIHLTRKISASSSISGTPSLCASRSPSTWGYFPYDGNVVGALLLGFGMSLTGSCPGTVMVQVGMGLRSGFFILAGSMFGGILFSGYSQNFKRRVQKAKVEGNGTGGTNAHVAASKIAAAKPKLTLYEKLNTSEASTALAFWATMLSFASIAKIYFPSSTPELINPLIGGALMAASQATSLLLTSNTLGVSAAYSTFGSLFWKVFSRKSSGSETTINYTPIFFTSGVALGSYLFWHLTGGSAPAIPTFGPDVSDTKAIIGGFLMAFGARIAGGCTSGHGISGMATLSLASFVSVAGMFGGGIVGASVFRALDI